MVWMITVPIVTKIADMGVFRNGDGNAGVVVFSEPSHAFPAIAGCLKIGVFRHVKLDAFFTVGAVSTVAFPPPAILGVGKEPVGRHGNLDAGFTRFLKAALARPIIT